MVRCSFQGIHLLNTVNDVLTLFVSAMSWYSTHTKARQHFRVPAAPQGERSRFRCEQEPTRLDHAFSNARQPLR
jgi:hypothetical protein